VNAKELFDLQNRCQCLTFKNLADEYWHLEELIADENCISYSLLEEYADAERRTCKCCGTVCHTDECGVIPNACENKQCAVLREFWGVQNFPYFERMNHQGNLGKAAQRAPYLKARMQKFFGCDRLAKIPLELRFDFLLIAHESNN
jgi:hypothetical protein